ncbi:hypothetical protein LCGC14_1687780, partial [marine sediment metagenome]
KGLVVRVALAAVLSPSSTCRQRESLSIVEAEVSTRLGGIGRLIWF